MDTIPRSPVTATPAADPDVASAHFSRRLSVETDADDVAAALALPDGPDFVLLDVRSYEAFAAGHLPYARHLPRRSINEATVADLPDGLVVVYCWGPGCNGASKCAAALAELGRPVKEMLGGFEYYVREGHPVEGAAADAGLYRRDDSGLVGVIDVVSCEC